MKITEDMKVCEILDLDRELEKILVQHGLACVGCPGAALETLREAAEGHGISVETLLRELNRDA